VLGRVLQSKRGHVVRGDIAFVESTVCRHIGYRVLIGDVTIVLEDFTDEAKSKVTGDHASMERVVEFMPMVRTFSIPVEDLLVNEFSRV
jgi:hypothetical protein